MIIAATSPIHGLPVDRVAENPATAPISIIPSTPRFRTPARSAKISPIAAKSSTVPVATPAAAISPRSIRCPPRAPGWRAARAAGCPAARPARGAGGTGARRSIRTRYRTSTSATIRVNRMIPWIIAGTPDGWISRPARISAPNRIDATTTRPGRNFARYATMIAVNP